LFIVVRRYESQPVTAGLKAVRDIFLLDVGGLCEIAVRKVAQPLEIRQAKGNLQHIGIAPRSP
jgi:hypothetical protein